MTFRAATSTTHLGRYHVVKRLATGGMADVLLARTDGIEGFQRHVVIKRIHSDLLEEPRYVKMFLDEARLAASLHHHNIVQVNDIGEEGGEYFFAMEYVHGEDARTLLVDASQREDQIPFEHVVTIVTGAAAGLHHAHEQRGPDGQPYHIVHRDVSPANILVGYDGAVKVADFGIALATHRAEQTQSGVLKGKVAYMSPEQCNCDPVDRRSDVFSLGIVLYELVTIRPCFAGDNDFMTMSAIVNGRIERPSLHRKDLPAELEAIIMKALAKSAADRYQSADEMRRALEDFAAAAGLRNSTTALADYMKQRFGTKALPWQEDDDDAEISIGDTGPQAMQPVPASLRQATPSRAQSPTMPLRSASPDDDLSIPLAPRDREEDVRKPTMPMRALTPAAVPVPVKPSRSAAILSPVRSVTRPQLPTQRAPQPTPRAPVGIAKGTPAERSTSTPARGTPRRRPTPPTGIARSPLPLPPRAETVPPPALVAADLIAPRPTPAGGLPPPRMPAPADAVPQSAIATASVSSSSRVFAARNRRNRKLWLAGSIAAVVIAGVSLILVQGGDAKPTPRASAAPRVEKKVAPTPLERPTVTTPQAIEPQADTPAPAPAKKSRKSKPAKKWDPDELFPK